METYLRTFAQSLRLTPEETRAIVAEVRGNLEDLAGRLRAQGYARDEAVREAVRRGGEAGGLARSMRWAHRGAPLLLQLMAVLLNLAGAADAVIGVDALLTAGASLFRHTDSLVVNFELTRGVASGLFGASKVTGIVSVVMDLLLVLTPGLVILAGAGLSLWLAGTVLLGASRLPLRRLGRNALAAVLFDGVLALALLATVPRSTPPPAAIPAAAQFKADGLVFRPAPGQPAAPVTIDRVYADRTATYVQYHIPNAVRDGEPYPALFDDRGRSYDSAGCDPCNGYASRGQRGPTGIQQMMPWRAAQPGTAIFAPLRADARAAVLQFGDYAYTPVRETVRVPIDLRPWRRHTGGAHPFIVVADKGIRVNLTRVVRGVSSSTIDFTVDATPAIAPRGAYLGAVYADLLDAHGQPIALAGHVASPYGDGCRYVDRGGGHCGPEWWLPSLPRGARLTLIVQNVVVYPHGWAAQNGRTITGPWRIPFVMP